MTTRLRIGVIRGGLGGTGKSYLVAEFVRRIRQYDESLDVFWASGETRETFEQSLARFL